MFRAPRSSKCQEINVPAEPGELFDAVRVQRAPADRRARSTRFAPDSPLREMDSNVRYRGRHRLVAGLGISIAPTFPSRGIRKRRHKAAFKCWSRRAGLMVRISSLQR